MEQLRIFPEDLIEKFILGSGKGGQKINKSSTCVYLKHLPSGIEVKCQRDRSREMNRYYARKELCDRLQEQEEKGRSAKQQEQEKIRRQKRRRSRRSKQKSVEDKRALGQIKRLRQTPAAES